MAAEGVVSAHEEIVDRVEQMTDGAGTDSPESTLGHELISRPEAGVDDLLDLLREDDRGNRGAAGSCAHSDPARPLRLAPGPPPGREEEPGARRPSVGTPAPVASLTAVLSDGPGGRSARADELCADESWVGVQAGWAERSADLAFRHLIETRKRAFSGPQLLEQIELDSMAELGMARSPVVDLEEVSQGQLVRAAVNELQHRLLTADQRADVVQLALERLMSAAGADRVCAFVSRPGEDGGTRQVLHAEITIAPELSLLDGGSPAPVAYEELLPGLLEQLSAGEPFAASIEFLPKAAAEHLAAQSVQLTMMLPLFVGGALYGFVRLDHCDDARLWSEAETGILLSAAGSISAAIERQLLLAELARQANKDALTGLANRRHLYARLEEELAQAQLHDRPVALLMLDIDDFKHLNDTYGHLAGDEVLRVIGRLLLQETDGADLAGRYGGEEFCLVLPEPAVRRLSDRRPDGAAGRDGHQERAAALAERLRQKIAAQRMQLGPGGEVVNISVSIGVASTSAGQLTAEQLIERADTALYAAKHAGKDSVRTFEDPAARPDALVPTDLVHETETALGPAGMRVPVFARRALGRRAWAKAEAADRSKTPAAGPARLEAGTTPTHPAGPVPATAGAFSVLQGLVTAIDNLDSYTWQHSQEVAALADAMALKLGLPEDLRRTLATAALLHDVGKIGVPVEVLRKPGGLTADEYETVKQHAALGGVIIQRLPDLKTVQAAVATHHEHFDGGGYPGGVSGDEIPLLGRILAIADAYSAMITDRPYRAALSDEEAVREIERCAGSQFDPALVAASRGVLSRQAVTPLSAGHEALGARSL